jgi:hypothetical protein
LNLLFLQRMLELESHSNDGPALVHVVDKIILVVVDIQNLVAKQQRNSWIQVVATAGRPRSGRSNEDSNIDLVTYSGTQAIVPLAASKTMTTKTARPERSNAS